jgi:hypothetical protein
MTDENQKTDYCVHVEPKQKVITGDKFQFHKCKIKKFMKRGDDNCIGSLYMNDNQYESSVYDACRAGLCPLFTVEYESAERANLAIKLIRK